MTAEQVERLKYIHSDLQSDIYDNTPGSAGPNVEKVARYLCEVAVMLGKFCDMCSGDGKTWRGECPQCKGKG